MKWFRRAENNALVFQDDMGATLLELSAEQAAEQEAAIRKLTDMYKQKLQQLQHDEADELYEARRTSRDLQLQLQGLKSAISSIVLRLKVLDLDQLAKDLGEDGTVPLRMALAELRLLVDAYDGIKKEMPDCPGLTTVADYGFEQQQANWTSTSTTAYYNYGAKKP